MHATLDAAGDRACEHRLRRARHVFEEDVPAAGERGEDELDLLGLAVHDRLEVGEEAGGDLDRGVGRVAHGSSTGKEMWRPPASVAGRGDSSARTIR